ncbi:beta strand repeat-containing protein, partial [Parasphingorhabdus litoris]
TQVNGNTTNINNINNGTTGAFRSENAAMDAAPSNAGPDAVAGGFGSQANASQATAIGNDALANGSNASAIGYGAQANAANAAAIGSDARANAANATALGFRASATNVGDVALGFGTRTSASTDAGYATATGAPANGIVGIGDRRIQGVAAGAEADEAVNVAQLNAVAQAGATAFGGGAAVDPMTGAFTAPTYTVGAANYDNVGAAITAQDDITTAQGNTTASTFGGTSDYDPTTGVVTGGFTYDATAQTTVQSVFDEIDADITNITNGDVGLVRQAGVPGAGNVAPITVGATTNGTEVLFNNLAGANRRLIGVANGAVTASSNEAVNGSQLFGVTTNIDALVGSGDVLAGTLPSFTTPNGGTADNVTDAFQEVTEQVDTNTTNIANNTTNITNLDNRVTTNETNIANNRTDIDQNRTDIDNLDNRVTVNETNIANNRTDIDTNTTNIANNRTDIDTNTTNIADNRTDIDQNTTNIADNRTDIDSNTTEINNITNGGGIKYFRADNTDQADAIASGENAIAAGQNAQALGTDSAAFGHNASAQGDNTTAVGAGATAFASTALGAGSAAAGGGTAVGDNARAGVDANNMPDGTNNNNAFGNDSVATGGNATALGYNSQATGENSTAVGNGAQATYANSTAVGAGAQTRMVDQVVLGTATSTVTAQGVLQNGDVTSDRIVSINAEGDMRSVTVADITEQVAGNITVVGGSDTNVNGPNVINIRDGSITSVDIADGAINTRNIADGAVTYNKLGADVRNRFNELNDRDNRNTAGVALATAIANIPQLSQEGKFSIGGAFGAFNGEGGWAFGANGRFSENVVGRTSVGITSQGDVAVGAGIAMEF